jgi:hypothetical protein
MRNPSALLKTVSFPHRRSTAVTSEPQWWHIVVLYRGTEIVGGACIRGTSSPWGAHFRAACMCRAFGPEIQAVSIMLAQPDLAEHAVRLGGHHVQHEDQRYTAAEAGTLATEMGIRP